MPGACAISPVMLIQRPPHVQFRNDKLDQLID
jgi:NADH:ubiquinone oxidoreductase subunit E